MFMCLVFWPSHVWLHEHYALQFSIFVVLIRCYLFLSHLYFVFSLLQMSINYTISIYVIKTSESLHFSWVFFIFIIIFDFNFVCSTLYCCTKPIFYFLSLIYTVLLIKIIKLNPSKSINQQRKWFYPLRGYVININVWGYYCCCCYIVSNTIFSIEWCEIVYAVVSQFNSNIKIHILNWLWILIQFFIFVFLLLYFPECCFTWHFVHSFHLFLLFFLFSLWKPFMIHKFIFLPKIVID